MKVFTITALSIVLAATAYAHSALDRFWGEVPVDMLLSGDVLVVRTLIVPEDVTLTIEPGTVVRFEETGGGNRIVVRGKLVAAGTRQAPISFVPKDEKTGPWYGIEFEPGGGGVLEHCVIEKASAGITGACGGVTTKEITRR